MTDQEIISTGIARQVQDKINAVKSLNETLASYVRRFAEILEGETDASMVAHWASVINAETKQIAEFANVAKGMAEIGYQVERMSEYR